MIKDGSMVPGRFYYVTGYFEESGWRQMPHDFIKFAEALFRATKKFCVKERWTEHLGEYIGPDAAKLHKEGLKFVPFFT